MKKLIFTTVILLIISIVSLAQVNEFKIFPSDGIHNSWFGNSVSISGNYCVVGAFGDADNGGRSGAAYIYKKEGENWIEEQKLIASDGNAGDWFGYSVSISGDYVIIGARWDDDNGERSGSAYIFRRNGSNWLEEQKLTASDGSEDDQFGYSVSASKDYIIVGAATDDPDPTTDPGSAYIFRNDGTNWVEVQKLTASDGSEDDRFGISVSISGDYAILGAHEDDDNGISSGSAYIFKWDGSNWVEKQKLLPSDGSPIDWFGYSVYILGDNVIVSAPAQNNWIGSAYIFKRNGTIWIEEQKLTASDGVQLDWFGSSVSISDYYAIVGAPTDDDNGHASGSTYIFGRDGGSWTEEIKILASDGVENDRFGTSVSISENYVIVGAREAEVNNIHSGAAYIDTDFIVGVKDEQELTPLSFNLNQNYPNPFNPSTTIKYQIPATEFVTLKVFDVLGNEIANLVSEEKRIGNYDIEFSASKLPSGIYFYRLQAGSFIETKKMILLK